MVPESIRKAARPKNTIVQATKDPDVYMVIKRVGCRYVGGRRVPVNGPVVGHIVGGSYVEKPEGGKRRVAAREPHLLKYGAVAFAHSAGSDLLGSLRGTFEGGDAESIYAIALLRAAFGDVKDYQLQDKRDKSWASQIAPNAALSKNSVSSLLSGIGKSYDLVSSFMRKRVEETVREGTKVLIDGMLKNDNSRVDSFSAFSYKGRIKGTKDLSILAAIDAERKEPIAMKVYPGNLPDAANIEDFIAEFSIKGGMEISDKGIPLERAKEQFRGGKVGFLRPIRRNCRKQESLGLLSSLKPLRCADGVMLASKAKSAEDGLHYYLFKDLSRSGKEESDYVAGKAKGGFDPAKYAERAKTFGTICFVSNMDLDPSSVYEYYRLRWEIEIVFSMYKGILSLNTTREHDDWATVGSEFVNYLSVIITCRMKNRLAERGLFSKFTFRDVMDRLNDCVKVSVDEKPGSWKMCSLSKKDRSLIEALGL